MPTESVEILIEAEDLASSKFRTVAQNAEASIKQIKTVGERAKKSTEFFGTLANSLGGSVFGSFAQQLAQITEKTTQFAEVSKAGAAGAFAFKAGLVAATGAIAFGVGKAIGDVVFQTAKLTREFEAAKAAAKELADVSMKQNVKTFTFKTEDIELIRDPDEKRKQYEELLQSLNVEIQGTTRNVNQGKKAVEEYGNSWGAMVGLNKSISELEKSSLAEDQARLKILKDQRDTIRDVLSDRTKENEELKKTNELKNKSESYLKGLRDEVELLKAKKEDIAAIEAARNTTGDADKPEAERLLRERDAIKENNEAMKKAESEKQSAMERSLKLQQDTLDKLEEQKIAINEGADAARVFALEKQGINKADAQKIVSNENEIARLKQVEADRIKADDRIVSELMKREQDKQNEAERIRDLKNSDVQSLSSVESRTLTVGRGRQNHMELIAKHLPWVLRELQKANKTQETIADNTEYSGREEIVKLEMQT